MEKQRTLEDFFVEKYKKLEEENKKLEESLELSYKREAELIQERDEYKNRFIESISRLKEDFRVKLKANSDNDYYIYVSNNYIWALYSKETYEYYKKLFNFKEGEEENE